MALAIKAISSCSTSRLPPQVFVSDKHRRRRRCADRGFCRGLTDPRLTTCDRLSRRRGRALGLGEQQVGASDASYFTSITTARLQAPAPRLIARVAERNPDMLITYMRTW